MAARPKCLRRVYRGDPDPRAVDVDGVAIDQDGFGRGMVATPAYHETSFHRWAPLNSRIAQRFSHADQCQSNRAVLIRTRP